MAVLHSFTIVILILRITSMVKTYSVVPYDNIHLAFSATPESIHTASEVKNVFNGYSYTTRDFNGDGSNVIFATGADSVKKLKNAVNSIYENEAEKLSEQDFKRKMLNKIEDNPVLLEQQSKFKEIEAIMNKQEDIDLNIEAPSEEKKLSESSKLDSNFIGYQTPHYQASFAPELEPTQFRTKLLNMQLPSVLSGYRVSSNVIQNPYYPYNSYTRVELPLHNFDFYNPTVPLFYQLPLSAYQIQAANEFEHSSTAIDNAEIHLKSSIIVSSDTNTTATGSDTTESNVIKSKSNFVSMANNVNEMPSEVKEKPVTNTVKSTPVLSEKLKEEITTESIKSTVKSESCCGQVIKMNNTKQISTEADSVKSSTETSTTTTKI